MPEMPDAATLIKLTAAEMCALAITHGAMPQTSAVTFSRKVFIPVTQLCRDVCHYCTFAKAPRDLANAYLDADAVLEIAKRGAEAGCKEALFTLGDQPEARYTAAREALDRLGHATTIDYVLYLAKRVFHETGLLPHINAGILSEVQYQRLREVSASFGLMLESASKRLCEPGMPHHGSPDKDPAVRLASLEAAGRARVAITSGLLIGIGETRQEIMQSLRALQALHKTYGHIQEILIQNFWPKPGTRMANALPAAFEDLLWAISATRLLFGAKMVVQTPPNLNAGRLGALVRQGVNDWAGVSPVTPDHVNPEAAWPDLTALARETEAAGHVLVERLCLQPPFSHAPHDWCGAEVAARVLAESDADGWARCDDWTAGSPNTPPKLPSPRRTVSPVIWSESRFAFGSALARADSGNTLSEADIVALFSARADDVRTIMESADELRRALVGDTVTFVVNMNINYTNICTHRCTFCAFSKGRRQPELSPGAYRLDVDEIVARACEAADRGATEVCLQGGIHPDYSGETYVSICKAIRTALPNMHIHAFSPLEVTHGARTLGLSIRDYLIMLRAVGLNSLPGTAAEILDDRIRPALCPDKPSSAEWLRVIRTAHEVGLPTTATIMFGHLDQPTHWARHMLAIRELQAQTGGITEFVPLPFIHREAPLFRKGQARRGPTFREAVLLHAIARLTFGKLIPNIQASWVKLGLAGASACLSAGVNDLGGTLMSESISRAAGAVHGQGVSVSQLVSTIKAAGCIPQKRTTLYKTVANCPMLPELVEA
jgi:FO synthase